MSFENLRLIEPIMRSLTKEGYTTPTPIQVEAIPLILSKKDILGCAQTGTGKTAAFSIPILQLMHESNQGKQERRNIKCLILTPTRELAIQIAESIKTYGRNLPLKNTVVYGGVNQHGQVLALKSGIDILIATPGRLLDLMNQGYVHLNHIEFFVLDEADRMLDMGFVNDVKRVIAKLPTKRQSLFFSATMPPDIIKLADTILVNPVKVEVTPVSSTADTIQQEIYFVDRDNKKRLLVEILKDKNIDRALVFTTMKHGADRVAKDLNYYGINAQAIHGNKSQNQRQTALNNFKNKITRVLVATDIAARGIDIDELAMVINYELPNVAESYVHRIGRTGRAGANGKAIAFCDAGEMDYLKDIQKLIGKKIPVVDKHPFPLEIMHVEKAKAKPSRSQRQQTNNSSPASRYKPRTERSYNR